MSRREALGEDAGSDTWPAAKVNDGADGPRRFVYLARPHNRSFNQWGEDFAMLLSRLRHPRPVRLVNVLRPVTVTMVVRVGVMGVITCGVGRFILHADTVAAAWLLAGCELAGVGHEPIAFPGLPVVD